MDGVTRAIRPVLLCLALIVPAVLLRLSAVHLAAPMALVIFGIGVVAASYWPGRPRRLRSTSPAG
jgi:cation:H+ antiporter